MSTKTTAFALAALFLTPASAVAFGDGQWGFSGRVEGQSCLACHGSNQYEGLTVSVQSDEEIPCFVEGAEGETLIPKLMAGQAYTVSVDIAAASASDVPCPTNDCCSDDAVAGDACLNRPGSNKVCNVAGQATCCQPGLTVCNEPLAGFNAEVVGGGAFVAGADTKLLTNGGDVDPSEISHTAPKGAGSGAQWQFDYTAPAEGEISGAVEFWVGANVANGNGFDDLNDLNSNFFLTAAVEDSAGNLELPGFCLACPNGQPPLFGSCCCNATVSDDFGSRGSWLSLALLSMLGWCFLPRRRSRR
jgi:hypothetical protein